MLYHLGVLHFLPTFLTATCYFSVRLAEGRWVMAVMGFCLIMFGGVFVDADHYWGKKAAPRRKEIWDGLRKGKITLGTLDPTKVNFFHTVQGFATVLVMTFAISFIDEPLAKCFMYVYALHILIIDSLDCDNQRVPLVSPLPTAIHNFMWRFAWFRWLCFGKPKSE